MPLVGHATVLDTAREIGHGKRKLLVKSVYLTTDGACIGNPGPGGWACVLRYLDRKKEIFGCEEKTTNNRMELRAVIEGLKMLREPCEVVMVTDSQYVKKGITEWLEQWKARGWQKKRKGKAVNKTVLNQDLWQELDRISQKHTISWEWVKGHATHSENNRCDELANIAARKQIYSTAAQSNASFLNFRTAGIGFHNSLRSGAGMFRMIAKVMTALKKRVSIVQ